MSKRINRKEVIMQSLTLAGLVNLFAKGRFATVVFKKKSDNSIRTLNGKAKVFSALKGGEASYNASEKNQMRVVDVNIYKDGVRRSEYRSVTADRVMSATANGVKYIIENSIPDIVSWIVAEKWNRNEGLTLKLNGILYLFHKVPYEVLEAYSKAESKGHFFNENIRNNFSYTRIG